jgi:hypothetical protein
MEYDVVLLSNAERHLNSLPIWLQAVMESRLEELSRSPIACARPVPSPPYPPGGMIFEFDHGPIEGTLHHIAIFFRFSQDETKLIVHSIGHTSFSA